MLVDVNFSAGNSPIDRVLQMISEGNGPYIPERIGKGMYLCGHWSPDRLVDAPIRQRHLEDVYESPDYYEYGVCDHPEQAVRVLGLEYRPEKFFVTFVKLTRANQPPSGGWRWHKWGPYIGKQEPQCEYLHDEPDIEEVYTFHVYEIKEDA
jgi:hypothetical protein